MDYFDSPPPYTPPSLPASSSSQPPPSRPRTIPQLEQPPSYHLPVPPKPNSRAATTKIISPDSELVLLKTLLQTHKWPSFYGPRPHSLTSALSKAALWGNHPLVTSLLATHACKVRDSTHSTAIHQALRGPAPELAPAIFRHFGSEEWILRITTSAKEDGMNALHVAARNGVPGGVIGELMGMIGMERTERLVDERDGRGRTALHLAARYSHNDAVDALVGLGADVEMVLDRGLWGSVGERDRMGVLGSWGLILGILREAVQKRGRVLEVDEFMGVPRDGKRMDKGEEAEVQGEDGEEGAMEGLRYGVYAGPSMSRTAMPLMLFSDEYRAWKEGCDTLLEESRAQKERDKRNESWMLDVMGPPPKVLASRGD
ncbi:hypothetical protein QBC40DRAFT_333837 [Triangularia verruculosa]|uniref:Ankyrin n=1 Tax=Triangularia verruculosa TaxID=2587418 RepID=A0AAN6XBS2_9PEZI|nr:hypothetical protein QBC40DRAFT_333837 [Triangularia verruculosa]